MWKIYTIGIGFFAFAGYYTEGLPRIWELTDFLLFIVTYAGLVSFSWSQRLFARRFWQWFVPLMLIWNVVYLFFIPLPPGEDMQGGMSTLVAGIIVAILYLPTCVGLFRYAYGKRHPWANE